MKYSNTVEYNIKTSLDSKGLTQLKSELQGLELKLQNMGNKGFLDEKTFSDARDQIQGLGRALSDAFNPSLGMLDLSKLNQELKNNDVTAQGLKTAFSSLGAEGQVAFNNLVGELGKLDTGILRTNSQIDKLFTTFSNTFRWGLVSSFFSQFMNAIHSSVDYVKELDDSLTQIMLVTDYNRDSMNQFAKSANEAAKAVSMTTTGMTNASLIFAQQGYDLNQSQELATLSAKVANASQQDTATTSDQITAYMNAYGLENSIGELTQAMDNWALIANISAADVGELAQASQRAASMANAVGVSGEQLASQIATIESVTREAPEQIGNGLKTLYARFSDIAAGGEDEDGFTLGKVTSELNRIGVQIFDEMGQIRDVGDIMEDLMVIWDDLDQTSKVAASQALAGKYQVNRFMALMDNSDMYEEYKGATGANAAGTLDMMNEEYAQSIEGRSAKLQASLEGLFSTIFNTDDIYPWMDAAQGAVDLLQQFFDALGGGKTVLLGISSLLMQVFNQSMAREINNAATNKAVQQQKIANLEHSEAALSTAGLINPNPDDRNAKNILDFARYMNTQALEGKFNAEQMNQANAIYEEMIQNANAATMANDKLEKQLGLVGTTINSTLGRSGFAPFADFSKAINSIDLKTVLGDLSDKTLSNFFKDAQEQVGPAKEGLLKFNQSLQEYSKLASNSGADTELLQEKMNELQQELSELSNYLDDSTFNRYDNALDEIANDTDNAEGKTNELATSAAHLAEELDKVTAEGVKKAYDNLQEAAFQSANADIAAEDSNATRLAFQEGNEKTDHIQNILNTMNAVQQLTFAWQAFQNLGSLWANEDLSTGEKVLQTIMNLTMAMPQLISALQSIKETQIFDDIGNIFSNLANIPKTISEIPKAAKSAGNTTMEIQKLLEMENKGVAAYDKMMEAVGEGAEIADGLEDVWRAGEKATETLGSMDQGLVELVKNGGTAGTELTGIAKIFADGMAASMTEGATGAGLFAGGLKAVGAAAAGAIVPLLPYLAIGAAIAGIAFIIGQEAEKAKKAKEEALEALDETQAKLEEIQNLESQTENFRTKFETMKSEGKGFDGLAEDAEAFADALEKAGLATESSTIRAAAYRAEVSGTAEDFEALTQEMERAQKAAEIQANNDNIEAAVEVLNTQKADFNEIINKQSELADLKRQLNELEADDPGRKVIQDKINALQDYISKNQEAVDAVNAVRASQEAIAGAKVDAMQGPQQVASLGLDDATVRAGTEAKYEGNVDAATLSRSFGEEVQGWDSLYTDLEKVQVMLNNVESDTARTSLKIAEMLMTSQGLTDLEGHMEYGRDKDQYVAGSNDYEAIMEQAGWTNEQSLKFVASLDEPVSLDEFRKQVADLNNQITEDTDLDVLLDAKLSDESKEELVKDQVAAYQPKDEDVDSEDFQSLSNHFFENEDKMGVEGTPFEDYSEDLLSNAEALEEVVEGILRFNDAVESIDSNYDDWKEALSDTSDLEGQATAIDDLQETYSDFLNLSEDMDVSEEFAANAENLDLMKAAAEGVEGAYEDLAMAAAEDILIHADVEDLDAAKTALEGLGSELPSLFEGVDIGGELDLSSVEDQINALAEATGWSADQMAAYLNSIGIKIDPNQFQPLADSANDAADAVGEAAQTAADNASMDVEANQVTSVNTATDEKQFTDAYPHVNPHGEQWSIDLPTFAPGQQLASGASVSTNHVTGWVPEITYTATPKPAKETKTDTSQATGYKYKAGKGATGKVQLKPNANATRSGGGSRPSGGAKPSGGGGGGGSCFVAGTLVTTLTGFSPIEQIKQGDVVLSYNELFHQLEYSTVVQTMIHDVVEPIYTLHIKDEQLRVTGIHRFLISHDIFHLTPQWVPAADLQIGDWMFLADGTWHLIHNIEVSVEHQIVYNFEVAGNHNYYVGRNQILAHNKGGKSCFVAGTAISTSLGFKPIEIIKADDIVLSYNESLHQNEYSKVVQTMIHDTIEPIYTLYIKNEQLRVTGIHRFLISKDINFEPQWVVVQDLRIGDWVLLADGTWHLIWKIEINLEHQTVYNFEVSGNHNYYVGEAQILAHNKGGGGKGGKGGGGGGKAKTIEPKEKKDHKKDYYEEVSNQLDKTEKILSKIEKEEDRLIGDKARANQNKQLDLLQKEIDLNKEKQKIQQQELKDVDELFKKKQKEAQDLALKNQIASIIPSAMYDEDGIIMNYEQISAALDKIHNQFIDKYNAAAKAGNEDLTKEIDKTLKKFDDYSKEILENAKRHDKLQSEIEDTTKKLEELEDKIEDIRIEAYKAHQEAIDDLKDLKEDAAELDAIFRDYDDNDFFNKWTIDESPYTEFLKVLNKLDNIFNVSKEDADAFYDSLIDKKKKALLTADEDERKAIESSIAYFEQQKGRLTDEGLTNGLLGLAQQDLEQLKGWWDGTNTESNPFGKNTAALKEAYEDAYKRLKDLQEDYAELVRDQKDKALDLADAAEDGIERQIDAYDRLNDKLEKINDTYQLYYGEDSYENILKIMDQQTNTMESELDQLKSAYSYWQVVYKDALAVGDEDFINEIEDKMNDAEEAMLDKAEELAEHFVDRYEKAVDAGIQKMTNNLWGGGEGQMDLEDQSTMWELQKDYMDTYKDDVEKAYEVDKLRSKYIGLLNDAQGMSLQTQNKIRAQMQEQLDLLQNQKTVSEYDVKLANAKLEILQKQIALEDAQRNKNKMQLRRDTQGNYRYVYTAEQGDVQQAQDELNESQYNAYEMTKEQTVANNDRAINLYQDYMDRMRDIANKYKDDEGARVAALAALNQEYKKLLGSLEEDFKDTTNGMYDVLTWMVENGTQDTTDAAIDMLDTLYDKNGQVKEDTGVAWRDLATQISEEVLPNIEDEVLETMDNIGDQASILKQKMTGPNGALDIIGSSAEKMKDSLSEAKDVTDELASATEQLFLALGAPDGALKKAINNLGNYANSLKDVQNSNSQLNQALKDSNTDLQAANAEKLHYQTALDYATGAKNLGKGDKIKLRKGTYVHYSRNNSQSDTTGATGWRLPSDTWVQIKEVDSGQAYPYGFYSTDTNNKDYFPKDSGKTDLTGGEASVIERHHQNWWFNDTELQKNVMAAMDTGGYTGEWQDQTSLYKNGKIAMLHQKELVLNATDTQNILSAVEMLRQITRTTSLNSFKSTNIGNIPNSLADSTIEQRVEIQASFPNATDADDIRTALLGLSDKAFQYAHRRI